MDTAHLNNVLSDFKKNNLIEYISTVLTESGPQQIAFENIVLLVWSHV